MTMRNGSPSSGSRGWTAIRSPLYPLLLAGLLGVAAAVLVSCGSSGNGLIPTGNAGPLQSDFEAVAQAAHNGNGSCTATETALIKTEQDFDTLPASIDAGLRSRLREGISKLRSDALALCKQPLPQATVTTTTPRTTTSTQSNTTPTLTQTTSTQTTPTTSTPTTSGPGGGTPAPGSEALPNGNEQGDGSEGGGAGGAGAVPEGGK